MGAETELVDDGRGGLVAKTDEDKREREDEQQTKSKDEIDKMPMGDDKDKDKDKKQAPPFGGKAPGGGTATGDGGGTPPKPMDEDEEDEDKKKPGPPAPPFGGKSDEAKKAIAEAAADLAGIVDKFKTAGVEVDAETQAKLDAATKALAELQGAFTPAEKNDEPGSNEALDVLKSAGADEATLSALNALLGRRGQSVEKAGARMAAERLERFRKAMDMLQSLLKEFLPADMAKSASGGSDILSMFDPSFIAGFKRNAQASPELVEKINKLTELVEANNERVNKIAKTAGGSNVIPLEPKPQQSDDQSVVWPLDMNRPITRETVNKDVSFFDVD